MSYADELLKLKRKFVIIALTGYTGSGCSTAARILAGVKQPSLPPFNAVFQEIGKARPKVNLSNIGDVFRNDLSSAKYNKLLREWEKLRSGWKPFYVIEVSTVIFGIALLSAKGAKGKTKSLILKIKNNLPEKALKGLKDLVSKKGPGKDIEKSRRILKAYKYSKKAYLQFKKECGLSLYDQIELMQDYGDNIRRCGEALDSSKHNPEKLFIIPEAIRRIIKAHGSANGTAEPSGYAIDSLRNPYEIEYFQRRYNEFYLVAVLRKRSRRKKALALSQNPDQQEELYAKIENRENGLIIKGKTIKRSAGNIEEWIAAQNVKECIQKAEVFIRNRRSTNKSYEHLNYNLIKLITLIGNPGSITPTDDERNMQLAMTARQMSGCISRQVGAVIVDKAGFVLGVGWNDPPYGQIPCALRPGKDLVEAKHDHLFSSYEKSGGFKAHIKRSRKKQINEPFCFREELATFKGEKAKRAEYTRALHAEENAFFQATKNSGTMSPGPTLYSTSVTCTLCAKKAYHLGVERIVYIDNYDDIALEQTVFAGPRRIDVVKFEGIVGAAFFKLYASIMPLKDWLRLLQEC